MAVSANEFWEQLTRIGVIDSAACDIWIAKFKALLAKRTASGEAHTGSILADDAKSIAQYLIANRVLTKFQSQRLIAGRGNELRLGDFLILDRCDQSPLSRWYACRSLRTSLNGFLYPCTDDLTSSRWVDLEWLMPHSAVKVASLQEIELVTLSSSVPWRGAIVSLLPSGRPLNQWAAEHGILDAATTASIGQVLANALAAMHDVGLVHGEFRPSRVWCGEDRSLWVLRDAGRPPAHPAEPAQEHRWFEDDTVGELYAAPELAGPHAEPTFASDLYALGAVLYELATGRRLLSEPFAGTIPSEISEACELGASGDPLMRTIAFAIDPDPDSRFPDVPSFARALAAVAAAFASVEETATFEPASDLSAPQVLVNDLSLTQKPTRDQVRIDASKGSTAGRQDDQNAAPEIASGTSRGTRAAVSPASPTVSTDTPSKPERSRTSANSTAVNADKRRAPGPIEQPTPAEPPATGERFQSKEQPTGTGTSAEESISLAPTIRPENVAKPTKDSVANVGAGSIPGPKPMAAPVGLSAKSIAAPPSPAMTETIKQGDALKQAAADSAVPPEPPPRKLRKRTRRPRRGPIIIGSIAAVVLLLIVGIFLRPSESEPVSRPRPPLPPRPVSSVATRKPSDTKPTQDGNSPATSGYELVTDDNLLWASPWPPDSKPPVLEMIPPGSQLVIKLRISRLVGDAVGSRWLDWLGPELKPAIETLEKRSSMRIDEIEHLTIASMGSPSGSLKTCFSIKTSKPVSLKSMTDAWNVSPSRTKDGRTIYSSEELMSDVYYVQGEPKDSTTEITSFVFGPADQITLVAENEGGPVPLPRSLQQLWDTSSQDADVVAMTVPNFLFADGRELLQSYAPRSIDSLRALLIPDVAGVTVSMSLVDHWYFETRFTPSGTVTPPMLLQSIKPKVDALPEWAEAFAIDTAVDPSWKAMAIRLPQFMRAITDQARYGISKTLPVANFYLPAEAAPQVALTTLLALSSAETAPLAVAATPEAMESLTIAQMIDRPFSVSFDQESLEFAVAAIRDEFVRALPEGVTPPTFTIIGGDLEKMGITQNQQIRNFQMRDKPLRDALTELVRQANPDKSVTSLTDPKQSLVWAVDSTAPADKPTILITTRPAAEAKKLRLSTEFTAQ